jgi:hypothetical protein
MGELFVSAPNTALRREVDLPGDDVEGLDALGLRWETAVVPENGRRAYWLFIDKYPIPAGYAPRDVAGATAVSTVTMAVRLTGYPGGGLDMVYVSPPLRRVDGTAIPNVSDLSIAGQRFQQWSRHYTKANPFRVGVDSIITHLALADEWFAREFRR